MEPYGKLSRLYRSDTLTAGATIALDDAQAHYLKNVLRKTSGAAVRIFNGQDGEYLCEISTLTKKGGTVTVQKQIRPQPTQSRPAHLLFAPIKKARMDFLIEKAVELGVTDLHPAITARTENRNLNESRLTSQIIEAAEQCERMTIPHLHSCLPLKSKLAKWDKTTPLYWCYERSAGAPHITSVSGPLTAVLIGPEGGFDESETALLSAHESVKPISLGETIYRAETAAFLCLSAMLLKTSQK